MLLKLTEISVHTITRLTSFHVFFKNDDPSAFKFNKVTKKRHFIDPLMVECIAMIRISLFYTFYGQTVAVL